ncbi:MAG: peptidylprolyl isomerase [Planctomycetota bacterium]
MADSETQIADGQIVSIHYTLTLDGGEQVDSSRGGDALDYLHGHGNIVPGLESELNGRKVGDKVNVVVDPEAGYGPRRDDAVHEVPLEQLPADVKVGSQLQAQTETGQTLMVHVTEVREDVAVVDFNHPLAGKQLRFDVEVMGIREATAEELDHGHAHGPGGHEH